MAASKYDYVPEEIFEIYVGLLKRDYKPVVRKSLLSKGSYMVELWKEYTEVSTGAYLPGDTRKWVETRYMLHPVGNKARF